VEELDAMVTARAPTPQAGPSTRPDTPFWDNLRTDTPLPADQLEPTIGQPDPRPAGGGPIQGQGQDGGQVGPRRQHRYDRDRELARQSNERHKDRRVQRYQELRGQGYSAMEARRYQNTPSGANIPPPQG
ncbi:MAG: hypothetical protein LBV45_09035, partial [Xanthomonadaceae bacterium]|jgi:hypothetical protein|nr:hypothetical protein [Xanthomonadaceae bacterium]